MDALYPEARVECLKTTGWVISDDVNSLKENYKLSEYFLKLAKTASDSGNIALAQSISVIGDTLSLVLNVREPYTPPFIPHYVMEGKRTADLVNISANAVEILKHALTITSSNWIIARINDILWLKDMNKDFKYVNDAMTSYIKGIKDFIEKAPCNDWLSIKPELTRVILLWAQTGRKAEYRDELFNTLKICMCLDSPEPQTFIRCIFLKLLADYDLADEHDKWISKAEEWCKESLVEHDYEKARAYLNCAVTMARFSKKSKKVKELITKQTDIFVDEVKYKRSIGLSPMILQHLYYQAIEANRENGSIIGSRKEIIDELHKELNEIQPCIMQELKPFHVEFNFEKIIDPLLTEIREQTTIDALLMLGEYAKPRKKASIIKEAEETMKNSILHLFASEILGNDGNVVKRIKNNSGNVEPDPSQILAEAYKHLNMYIFEKGYCINVVRHELMSRFDVDEDVFNQILNNNPFVPKNRIEHYKKALWAGFRGHWHESMYILIPQLENSLRYFLEAFGLIVTRLEDDLVQQKLDLNSLLNQKHVEDFLGENLYFLLRGVFVEKSCLNYRNRLAHGLLSDVDLDYGNEYQAAYIWALTIFLCEFFKNIYFHKLLRKNDAKETKN